MAHNSEMYIFCMKCLTAMLAREMGMSQGWKLEAGDWEFLSPSLPLSVPLAH